MELVMEKDLKEIEKIVTSLNKQLNKFKTSFKKIDVSYVNEEQSQEDLKASIKILERLATIETKLNKSTTLLASCDDTFFQVISKLLKDKK